MSSIRTLEQLVDKIDGDLAWRKRELTTWSGHLGRAKSNEIDTLVRGAWAILYAHWEGFVKQTSLSYLEYVSSQGLRISDLSDEIAAIALRSTIASAAQSTHGTQHTQVVAAVRAGTLKANIPVEQATIKTNANLKYETFVEILLSIGCDPTVYAGHADIIDSMLLKHRNDIAHGKFLLVDRDKWESLREKVVIVMDGLRTQVENRAAVQGFRIV